MMQIEQFNVKDIGKPFEKTADKVADTGKRTGGKIADIGKKTGSKIADTGKKTGGKLKDVGGGIKNLGAKFGGVFGAVFKKIWSSLKFIFGHWRIVLSIVCCVCFMSVAGPFITPLLGLGRAASSLVSGISRSRPSMRYNR